MDMRHLLVSGPRLQVADGAGGGGTQDDNPASPTGPTGPEGTTGPTGTTSAAPPEGLSTNQQDAWIRLVSQRDQFKNELANLQAQFLQVQETLEGINKEKRDAADEAARQAGKHEELATIYKDERDKLQQQFDNQKNQITALEDVIAEGVQAQWKGLPDKIKAVYSGAEDDVVAKWKWLHSKGVADLVKDMTEERTETQHGVARSPRPNGSTNTVEQEKQALLERTSLKF